MRCAASFLGVLMVLLGGCSSPEEHGGSNSAVRFDEHHALAEAVTVRNLTVWPVTTDAPLDLGGFLTLQEAVEDGKAEVREQGAEGQREAGLPAPAQGREPVPARAETADGWRVRWVPAQGREPVPARGQVAQVLEEAPDGADGQTLQAAQAEGGATVSALVIENRSDLPILVCAGTVVKGGNQDRQIGQDFVVKAGTTVPVEAFCVEQGRWSGERLGEATNGGFYVASYGALAAPRLKAQYEKDQAGVWEEVGKARELAQTVLDGGDAGDRSSERDGAGFGVTNFGLSTSFAVALDAAEAVAGADIAAYADPVRARFDAVPEAVGFAYAVDGKVLGIRTFAHPRLLRQHLETFVRTMAHEAHLAAADGKEPAPAPKAEDVVALVRSVDAAAESVNDTAGLNRNGLRAAQKGYGSTCYLPQEGKLAALTRDWTAR